jgi:hypothetical protein
MARDAIIEEGGKLAMVSSKAALTHSALLNYALFNYVFFIFSTCIFLTPLKGASHGLPCQLDLSGPRRPLPALLPERILLRERARGSVRVRAHLFFKHATPIIVVVGNCCMQTANLAWGPISHGGKILK